MYLPAFPWSWRRSASISSACQRQDEQQEREKYAQRRFYDRCDRLVQNLLCRCDWKITWRSEVPILTITCPNSYQYGQILHEIYDISLALLPLARNTKIRIYRPLSWLFPLEVSIDEILQETVLSRPAS